ncbi:MAG: FtsX-like permease family protein [Pseudomonadota bacterium]
MGLLTAASIRYMARHPWLMGLSVLGVALGVALVVSIDLANESARRAFSLSSERVTGKASHQIVASSGNLDEQIYTDLRIDQRMRDMAPVVEGFIRVSKDPKRTMQVLGVDALAEGPFRSYTDSDAGVDLTSFMARPNTCLIADETAQALQITPGDTLSVIAGGQTTTLTLVGVLQAADERSAQAMADLMVVDIATAQELFRMPGQISHVDLLIPDTDAGSALQQRIEAALPGGTQLMRSSARSSTLVQMTRAFELNLTALSLLALIVGMFLVYNTMTFSVVQRRWLIGRLRTLGVTRKEIFQQILGEAALIAFMGTVLGLLLGIVLGQSLVQLVTQTINDLYYVISVRDISVSPFTLLKGIALGVGATLLAAVAPAREATAATPGTVLRRSLEETNFRRRLPKLAGVGLMFGITGTLLLLAPGRSIVVSYSALFLILVGYALLIPWLVDRAAAWVRPLLASMFGMTGRMAAGGIRTSLSRTSIAIAALMVAIAATIGVGVMVNSFRQTVTVWLDRSLQADIYISPPSMVMRRVDATLDDDLVDRFLSSDLVTESSTGYQTKAQSSVGQIDLVAFHLAPPSLASFAFKEGQATTIWPAFEEAGALLISEPLSYKHNLHVGDVLELDTKQGKHAFDIVGVYFDYGSDLGTALLARPTYEQYFGKAEVSTVALYLRDDVAPADAISSLRALVDDDQEVLIRANQTLRALSMDVFDRTFAITNVLRLLAIGVAFIGILSAFMALQLERARELAVLRATGVTPAQLWRYVTLQSGLMGLLSGLLSLPLGLVLAGVLIFVINKRSFGWTMQVQVAPDILLQAVLLGLIAALLAALYPAWRMAQANPSLALREE